jgi:hypothetical protein
MATNQPVIQFWSFGTFVGHRDVFGREATRDELLRIVQSFQRSQLLIVTTRLGILLQSWMNRFDAARQDRMTDILFQHSASRVKEVRRRFDTGLVFTRLGLLYLLRQIIEHGREDGRAIVEAEDWDSLGRAVLMCNDLYLGYTPSPNDDVLQEAAGFIPAYEYLPGTGFLDEVARSILMVQTILTRPEVLRHADYCDINEDFADRFGLSPVQFCNVIFGIVAQALELAEQEESALAGDLVIRSGYFALTSLDSEHVERVLRSLTASIDDLKVGFEGLRNGADLTPIQRQPLMDFDGGRLCLDPAYAFEKAGRAFFWVLRSLYDGDRGDQLLRFWGRVLESYHQWIWDEQYQGTGKFVPNPRYLDDSNDEIADAVLLEADSLLLFECKASVVTSDAKYSFSGTTLGRELDKKFVEDIKEKKRAKGVGQLARAIRTLASQRRGQVPFSLNKVERIYSVLITLDPVIEGPSVREYLNQRFVTLHGSPKMPETVTPLFVIHIADLERLLSYTNVQPLSLMLRTFTQRQHQAKYFPGPIADYMGRLFKSEGVRPGRDTVGQRIDQIVQECRAFFLSN